jgi:Tfp pilus assembly protein PilV
LGLTLVEVLVALSLLVVQVPAWVVIGQHTLRVAQATASVQAIAASAGVAGCG